MTTTAPIAIAASAAARVPAPYRDTDPHEQESQDHELYAKQRSARVRLRGYRQASSASAGHLESERGARVKCVRTLGDQLRLPSSGNADELFIEHELAFTHFRRGVGSLAKVGVQVR